MGNPKAERLEENESVPADGSSWIPSGWSDVRRYVGTLATNTLLALAAVAGTARAQSTGVCSSPMANAVNEAGPTVIMMLIIGSLVLTYCLNIYSGYKRDPSKVQEIKEWRNRAGMTAVTTPILAWLIIRVLNAMNVSIAGCINILPF